MVVVKNRYLVMEVLCEGEGPALTHSSITNAIRDSILHNFGELGLAASLPSLQVKYVNPVTKLCVIRCSRAEYERIWCAITFITSISNCSLFFNLLDLSGGVRDQNEDLSTKTICTSNPGIRLLASNLVSQKPASNFAGELSIWKRHKPYSAREF